jgi:diadenosine tetraphosphatase ApaH/serine/threonine PP2A family protein phosphatase
MRYLVLSDIHANLEALDQVLAVAGTFERTLVLGDLVGYGADPNAVIARVRDLPHLTTIRGNHDKVAAGLTSVEGFNQLAKQAIQWTALALTPENRTWLAALPTGPVVVNDLVEICHGAPFDEDFYVFDDLDAQRAIEAQRRPLCLFGHTHVPTVFTMNGQLMALGPARTERFEVAIDPGTRYLVNCGAVGQPRDTDPRAAYGLLDMAARTIEIRRIPYDVATAQAKIVAAGLPGVLAQRLALGR